MKRIEDIKKLIDMIDVNGFEVPYTDMKRCVICPRECNINRFNSSNGYCKSDTSFSIAKIYNHKGEEPAISGINGICNVFFTGCNLRCKFCQNFQISNNISAEEKYKQELSEIILQITEILDQGCKAVGFVSPSHQITQMLAIINTLKFLGIKPVIVMNTNAYDKASIIRKIGDYVDVYLPDFKYFDNDLGKALSDAPNYSEIAIDAITEMYLQKGDKLITDNKGDALSGLIIRHLVLPGYIENSISVLRAIAKYISNGVHISLMSQYQPTKSSSANYNLKRTITVREYETVVDEIYRLGFENGWVQDIDSAENYNPDFSKDDPFN